MTKPAKYGHGGMDPEKVQNAVSEIEDLFERKMREHMEYMATCAQISKDIAAIYDAAKDSGIPRKELKKVVKTRELERKVEAIRNGLEAEEQETYDQIRHALGDLGELPLGKAALDRAKAKSGAVDSLAH